MTFIKIKTAHEAKILNHFERRGRVKKGKHTHPGMTI